MKYQQMFLERGYIIDAIEPVEATNPVATYVGRKTATKQKVLCYEAIGSHRGILAARCLKIQAGRSHKLNLILASATRRSQRTSAIALPNWVKGKISQIH